MELRDFIQKEINQLLSSSINSEQTDLIFSKKRKERGVNEYNQKKSKPIIQYKKDGTFVREFRSIAEANRFFGLSDKHISKHLRGKSKTCLGCIFKFKE